MRLVSSFTVLFLILLSNHSIAQNYVFASLGTPTAMPTTGWNLTGNAFVGDTPGDADNFTNELILTNSFNTQSGAVFYNSPINLSVCTNWEVQFDYRIWGGNAADGLAFCFLNVAPTGFVSGGGVGIPATANGLKVVIDTWDNCGGANPELQMYSGIGYSECILGIIKLQNIAGNLNFIRSNAYQPARVTYNNGVVNFFINNILYLTGTLPVNFTGYMGFTASTGGANDQHSIKNVVILTQQAPSNAGINVVTCDDEPVQIGSAPNPNYVYTWSPATGVSNINSANPMVTVNNPGTTAINVSYTVSTSLASSPGVCPTTDVVVVNVKPTKNTSISQVICDSNYYVFQNDTVLNSGIYVDTLSTSFGCDSIVTLNLTLVNSLDFDIPDTAFCIGNSLTTTLDPNFSYAWTPTFTANPSASVYLLQPTISTNYVVLATSSSGCVSSDTFDIDIFPLPQFSLQSSDTTPCFGDAIAITASPAANSYLWTGTDLIATTGEINGFISQNSGFYSVLGTDGYGCQNTDSILITVLDLPVLSLTPNLTEICAGEIAQLNGSGAFIYTWNPVVLNLINDSTANVSPLGNTLYTMVGETADGCIDSVQAQVIVHPNPTANFTLDLSDASDFSNVLSFVNNSNGAVSYSWDFGDGSPFSEEMNPTHPYAENYAANYEIILLVTNEFGCTASATDVFITEETVIFYVPNSFTPDDDEFNQTFKPVFGDGIDAYNFRFTIYNRWGAIVFESLNKDFEWDGTYGGKLVQDGMYTYEVVFKLPYIDDRRTFTGSIAIIR